MGKNRWIAGLVIMLTAATSVGVGCALDDTAITAAGAGDDASIFDGGGASEASTDGGPVCAAKTCDNYPSDCHHALSDGCGKTIDCFTACPGDQKCVDDGGPDAASFFCNGPPVCNDAGEPGNSCGVLTNPGNGLQTNCGGCDAGFSCASSTCGCEGTQCPGVELCCPSASGTPNCNDNNTACCARKACASDLTQCSPTFSNGCGGALDCSNNCTGNVAKPTCDPTNHTCCAITTTCGTNCNTDIPTDCNTTMHCPSTCAAGVCIGTSCCLTTTCNGVCCPVGQTECNGTACCMPEALATTCNGLCGSSNDNCGVSKSCGVCTEGKTCAGPADCTCGSIMCNPGQKCHTTPDNCTP